MNAPTIESGYSTPRVYISIVLVNFPLIEQLAEVTFLSKRVIWGTRDSCR